MPNKANFVCLDLGDTKISVLVANVLFENQYEILHTSVHPSDGLKRSEIVNFEKTEKNIEYVLNFIEKSLGYTIDTISIVFSGSDISSYYVVQEHNLEGGVVKRSDVKNLAVATMDSFKMRNRLSPLHCFPIDFHVDEYKELQNPIGMAGERLACNFHIISVNPAILQSISDCFAKCNVNVDEFLISTVMESVAYAKSNIQGKDMVVIDFGHLSTSFTVLSENAPLFCSSVPIGGHHVTNDLAQVLSISTKLAEKVKILFCDIDKTDSITLDLSQIKDNEEEFHGNSQTIETRLINDIVRARLKETLNLIKAKVKLKNKDILRLISKKVVITGRGSKIKGLKALCANVFEVDEVKDSLEYWEHCKEYQLHDDKAYTAVLASLEYRAKNYLNYYAPAEEKRSLFKRFFNFFIKPTL